MPSIDELEKMIYSHDLMPNGTVQKKIETFDILAKRLKDLQSNSEESTITCICMDCGKIINVSEQSAHICECERKDL